MNPTTFNLTTLLLFCITGWVIFVRHRTRPENNWPLFYYVALIAYSQKFDNIIKSDFIFVAVVSALLLRFEFMSGWILKLIMYIETACLVYVLVRCLQVLFGSG